MRKPINRTEHTMKLIILGAGGWLVVAAAFSAARGDVQLAIWFALGAALAILIGLIEWDNELE
jgi:hypothetical protein